MLRKNFAATGAFLAEDRPRALDLLGFSSQLVFNTFHNRRLRDWEHGGDLDFAYGVARAHNRGMIDFCAVDPRLLATCYVPLADFDRAAAMAGEALDAWVPPRCSWRRGCPPGHSPSHRGLDPVWAEAQEARHPRRVPRRRHRRPDRPQLLPQRTADPARLPRRRGELPVGRLHGRSRPAGADAGDDDLRRRARAVSRVAHRRDRARRDLGAVAGCARWSRAFEAFASHEERLRELVDAPERVRAAARSASRRIPPRTSGGSSSRRGQTCACSRRTTRMSRAAAAPSNASRPR